MKKVYIFALAGLLASCSNEEVEEAKVATSISFQPVAKSALISRADATTTENIKNKDFVVYAFTQNDELYMGKPTGSGLGNEPIEGVKIHYAKDAEMWNYASEKDRAFWPMEPLNFYAFCPAPNPGNEDYVAHMTADLGRHITYQVPEEADNDLDLLLAKTEGVERTTANGKVNLAFQHALSQVVFKVSPKADNLEIELTEVTFHNMKTKGQMDLEPNDDLSTDKWKSSELGDLTLKCNSNGGSVKVKSGESKVIGARFFIPQTITRWEGNSSIETAKKNGEFYMSLMCKIKQNGKYICGSDHEYTKVYMISSAIKEWKPGITYNYNMSLRQGFDKDGQKIVAPVEVEPTVSEFMSNKSK